MMNVQIPQGVGPGMQFSAQTPAGVPFTVTCPAGMGPGMMVSVQPPMAPAPQPQAIYAPAPQPQVAAPKVLVETVTVQHGSDVANKQRLLPDSIDESKMILLNGCFCCNTSLLFSQCCGCAAKVTYCCCEYEACIKIDTPPLRCCCCDLRFLLLLQLCCF